MYEVSYDGELLASFKLNCMARDFIANLLNGGTILGETYPDHELFRVSKDGQRLALDIRIEVSIGGY